ncbi:hypothetical protein [Actinoplanes siamensis]|uniref:Uncharacterized protein n=1 Tax=Actinoplanes siamensis TaxID=1223317 RepID=A0A919KC54_9ACTN|nr:hypothetical protein [Actinoplanes siamensis]GIF02956.1 hypothetical protein Asi03nite_04940 [Actinoplanes siamensis]
MSFLRGFGVLASGLTLVLSATSCSSADDSEPLLPGSPESASAAPTAPASAAAGASTPAGFAPVGPGAEIRGGRQFVFATTESGGRAMLTVGPDGILTTTDHLEDRALFVTTPVRPGGDEYLLQTAKLVQGGEPWCLQVHSPGGGAPLDLKTAACDAAERDQIFTFPKTPDGKGRLIEVNGLFALAGSDEGKVVVQESGEGDAMSSFTVRDQGESTLPQLGD